MSLAQLGRFREATAHGVETMRLAESTQRAFAISQACFAVGTLHLLQGDWRSARSTIERGISVTRAGNIIVLLWHMVAWRALVLAQAGDTSEALTCLREAEQRFDQQAARGHVGLLGWSYPILGRARLLLGSLDEARRLGERACDFSALHPGFNAHALHLLGDIATHPDQFDPVSAEGHYRCALTLAEPRGMRPLIAHCHLGLGKVYRRTGKLEQAEELLISATTLYREMDMHFWLEKARAETLA
jgi:tetratricopeptide (TPR) repeat protein